MENRRVLPVEAKIEVDRRVDGAELATPRELTLNAAVLVDVSGRLVADRRRAAAFALIAERALTPATFQSTLDSLAEDVLGVTSAVTCTVVVLEQSTGNISAAGAAGDPRQHMARIQAAMQLGAPLHTLAAADRNDARVERDLPGLILADSRFAPLASIAKEAKWKSLVAVPLTVQNVVLGVLTVYYPSAIDPDDAEVPFLNAIADQVAVTLKTARLFAEAQERATADEQSRLARDLHDSISQNLYSLVLQARALQLAANRGRTEQEDGLNERLSVIRTLAEAALDDIRNAIMHLRTPESREVAGLCEAIREHAVLISERDAVRMSVRAPQQPLLLSLEAEQELLRIVMEASANSVRHGLAENIEILVAEVDDRNGLVVTVSDDGGGFDITAASVSQPGHVGLQSMRERAEHLGGELHLSSCSRGTTVRVEVPYSRWPASGL